MITNIARLSLLFLFLGCSLLPVKEEKEDFDIEISHLLVQCVKSLELKDTCLCKETLSLDSLNGKKTKGFIKIKYLKACPPLEFKKPKTEELNVYTN